MFGSSPDWPMHPSHSLAEVEWAACIREVKWNANIYCFSWTGDLKWFGLDLPIAYPRASAERYSYTEEPAVSIETLRSLLNASAASVGVWRVAADARDLRAPGRGGGERGLFRALLRRAAARARTALHAGLAAPRDMPSVIADRITDFALEVPHDSGGQVHCVCREFGH